MVDDSSKGREAGKLAGSVLDGPTVNPVFKKALDALVAVANQGQRRDSEFFNPSNDWLINRMRMFHKLTDEEQRQILEEYHQINKESETANAEGKAARRSGPDVVFRLDTGGLASYSQLGVARRPDLTQYFIDGFQKNRDSLAFSEANQKLFAEVFPYIAEYMKVHFASGDIIIQSDRQICDVPGRSFHARQLLFGVRYPQLPYMWRQLTFDLPETERNKEPDILEISIPHWLDDLSLPKTLISKLKDAGLTQLVFRAPTKGLSLHLGFDYLGEHKMGPLTIAMFLVKQSNGLAIQAALSMARIKTLDGAMTNTALVTAGPSLHGKSTLTIMIDLADSDLARLLGIENDPEEGVYPMNDDIVLLQPLPRPTETTMGGSRLRITHGIDGTENNFYAVPYGLTHEDDPITYDVVRGAADEPNPQETLENVVVNPEDGTPDFLQNPVRNMRMILSRQRLLTRKSTQNLLSRITNGRISDAVHVPMENTDRVLFQSVMRQNTVVPPIRRLSLEQFIRVLMYGEAVQMGAAIGAIDKPYVEYFSDPFIIGLEDDNANLLYYILQQMERGGLRQEYYVFNTGGVGADSDEEASGAKYKKIPREITLMLQEAVLRGAAKFEYDAVMGADVAVAIVNEGGEEVFDLRAEWLPRIIYGKSDYYSRVLALRRRRYYGRDAEDKAGILRYTKVADALIDLTDVPPPSSERELAWLLSFHWNVDQAYNSLPDLARHRSEGLRPASHILRALKEMCDTGLAQGSELSQESHDALKVLGINHGR